MSIALASSSSLWFPASSSSPASRPFFPESDLDLPCSNVVRKNCLEHFLSFSSKLLLCHCSYRTCDIRHGTVRKMNVQETGTELTSQRDSVGNERGCVAEERDDASQDILVLLLLLELRNERPACAARSRVGSPCSKANKGACAEDTDRRNQTQCDKKTRKQDRTPRQRRERQVSQAPADGKWKADTPESNEAEKRHWAAAATSQQRVGSQPHSSQGDVGVLSQVDRRL